MITLEQKNAHNLFLQKLSESLDISESLYQKIEDRYRSIGEWLNREQSRIDIYSPVIYPQGSIRLGTVIKPVNDEDEYDVDLVCELQITKEKTTQKYLKDLVGNEIKGYAIANNMKKPVGEGCRCWTLKYSESENFHADILPAVPDGFYFGRNLAKNNYSSDWSQEAIAITDNTNPFYEQISQDWSQSNPKGYALWFQQRMKVQYGFALTELVKKGRVENIDILDSKIRTPLQRAVQILKRHRDIMFADETDDKPISIIITTLAALSYDNEANLVDAIINIVQKMPGHILQRDGVDWIPNPVNPMENFADKWHKNPKKKENFKRWLYQVKTDFLLAFELKKTLEFSEALKPFMGDKAVDSVSELMGFSTQGLTKSNNEKFQLGDYSHTVSPTWPMEIMGSVDIVGHITMKSNTPTTTQVKTIPLINGRPVRKGLGLVFQARVNNIQRPYKIHWQVVNTGQDAIIDNGLRGGFYEDEDHKRTESTRYKGVHWIQCFVIKEETCVAMSKKFIVKIN
ncbi:MAG: nucleotidyltransferase [Anaerolineales bacterium]|nr:nucleotidyltransferase [Anaerolineales bacterium]